jgi:hypothetical protein
VDTNDAQPVEEILAELSLADTALEVRVGGSDDSNVDTLRSGITHRQDLSLFEETEGAWVERRVAGRRSRPETACLRPPSEAHRLIGDCPGKAPAAMAEELTIREFARRAGAVIRKEHVFRDASDPAWMARATRSLPVRSRR